MEILSKQPPATLEQMREQIIRIKSQSLLYPDPEQMSKNWWYAPIDDDHTIALRMKRHTYKVTIQRYQKYLRKWKAAEQMLHSHHNSSKADKLIRSCQEYAWLVREFEWRLVAKGR